MISIFSFVSQQLLFFFFGFAQALAVKPGISTYFSVIAFLCLGGKKGFQTQLFKTRVLTQTETVIFWFTLTGPNTCAQARRNSCTMYLLKFIVEFSRGHVGKCSVFAFASIPSDWAWTSLYMDGTAVNFFKMICPHEA